MVGDPRFDLTDLDALAARFEAPSLASTVKELDHIDAHYGALIAASPFVALATSGADGLDCSPRGDAAGFVEVVDPRTLVLPDRRGNNRLDSLRNLVVDPRLALLFLIPGVAETLRVNGRARLSTDPALTARYAVEGRAPKLVLVIAVEAVFYQCARAVARAQLWDPARHVDRARLPSAGQMLQATSQERVDGQAYDRESAERLGKTLY